MVDGDLPGFKIGKLWRIRPDAARAASAHVLDREMTKSAR
jgi:hypothetical protein